MQFRKLYAGPAELRKLVNELDVGGKVGLRVIQEENVDYRENMCKLEGWKEKAGICSLKFGEELPRGWHDLAGLDAKASATIGLNVALVIPYFTVVMDTLLHRIRVAQRSSTFIRITLS